MQDRWKTHVEDVSKCCSTEFWFLFNSIKELTVQCQDKVLKTVKTLLCDHGMEQNCGGRKWPQSNRGLRARVNREAGNFWDHVLHTKTICLRRFKLPHCESVKFTYIDPIFVWIQHCNMLHRAKHELQWKPKELHHPTTHEKTYGAGVQYGLVFHQAFLDVPSTGQVALMNLSWDGGSTGYGSRSATPICLQVMNTNTSSVLAVGLVAYLPHLDVPESVKKAGGKPYRLAMHHVLQVSLITAYKIL